ncbi:methionine-S-sulfoxide reductase [Alicyclobacillus tengchongensis]|uniref:Peptide methionine sulfoxide reductase MsrA n=1 Tax=Alicyclobacillus tolerans TaxID=90970 RepID=A0ABT9LSD0_9BACL|nr:methionine-S-sulfoxide reductase [Alicyclobacillus tengchongensis]
MNRQEIAIFAGGCFWCMVNPFDTWPGVLRVESGYTGGDVPNPTYEQVCSEMTGHVEAVRITYDPEKISYQELLNIFWRQIDPTDAGGQFYDRGSSYQTAIFYFTEEQRQEAIQSKNELAASGRFDKPIVTPILPAKPFYLAEDYHQNYYQKQPLHYERYHRASGRADFTERHWGGSKSVE